MGREAVAAILRESGVAFAYKRWEPETPPPLPYALYRYVGNDGTLKADNVNYFPVSNWAIELYSAAKEGAVELSIEDALTAHGCAFAKHESAGDEGSPSVTYLFSTVG